MAMRSRMAGVRQDGDVVFSEIDAGLEHGDQLDQFLFDWLQALGQSAFELLGGDLRLVKRLGVDRDRGPLRPG